MKLSRIILVLLLSNTFQNSSAQLFNGAFMAGISASQVDGDTQKDYKKPGFYAGVFVEVELRGIFGLKSELYYIGKGAKKSFEGIEEFNTSLHYVEMPFLLCLKPLSKVQFDLGFAGSYLIGSKLVNFGETVEDGLYDMHNFDFSAMVGLIYYLNRRIGLNARFDYSLLPVKKYPNWYNNNFCLGLMVNFKGKENSKAEP